ncbi:mycothione reductase [Nakamurella antarctica]|uniref:Mycothione reductase n=1 Tax=Nakamurella antarctica TaxID=1902245 RepID=A0A3G8ZLA9_9ACTN|nr:mycothione reductase [Nakamurella antarctica]AZI58109.1 mycothione reductase [Nakamurella antarctica]
MRHFDLIVIGTGSGNSIVGPEFDDWDIAILEKGLFGGTCLNVGCIPTKMYVHPADLAYGAQLVGHLGVDAAVSTVHWREIRDRIFGRIDAIEAGGRDYRTSERTPNITVYTGTARFTGATTIDTGTGETITGDRIVVAAGGRPIIPNVPGLSDGAVPFHTSDTIMRINKLPTSLIIIGGGYIAAEFAHVFASFGCKITQLNRGASLLSKHDSDISATFTQLSSERYTVALNCDIQRVARTPGGGVIVETISPDGPVTYEAAMLLVATGRQPNTDVLDVAAAGLATETDGRLVVDEYQRTNVEGIFALGDISSEYALKHVANHESRVVAHNLKHPEALIASDHRFVPAAVFTHPQIAAVGMTEQQAKAAGVDYVVSRQDYGGIAAGWAREDTTGFLKLLADPTSGKLLGAHIIGPEAATVIQPLIQAMSFGQSARELARGQYWIHPALSELLENALLNLPLHAEQG